MNCDCLPCQFPGPISYPEDSPARSPAALQGVPRLGLPASAQGHKAAFTFSSLVDSFIVHSCVPSASRKGDKEACVITLSAGKGLSKLIRLCHSADQMTNFPSTSVRHSHLSLNLASVI